MYTLIEPSRSMSHTDALASLRYGGTAVCCYKEQPRNKLVTLPPIDPSVGEPMCMYSQQERNQGRVLRSSHTECNEQKSRGLGKLERRHGSSSQPFLTWSADITAPQRRPNTADRWQTHYVDSSP